MAPVMRRWFAERSFRLKLIALVLFAEAITLGTVFWQGRALLDEQLREQVRQRIEQINPLLNAALALPLAQRDYAAVDDIVRQAMAKQTLSYLVVESQGRIVARVGLGADVSLPQSPMPPTQAGGMVDIQLPISLYGESLGTAHYGVSLAFLDEARQRLEAKVINSGIGGAVLVLLLLGPFAFWLLRRLSRFEQTADAFAAGDLARRVDVRGGDEIDRLGRAFNRMADSLGERIAEVRELNDQLEARVRVRTAELTTANRELEAFSYSVSHDLSAPLRAIDGFARMLEEDEAERLDAAGREHLHRVRSAAQRMQQIIDGLLCLSRVTRNEMAVTRVNLSALAGEILGELGEANPERRVEVVVAPGMEVTADAGLLRRALENLLRNAWKFTSRREEARIEVGVETAAGESIYYVRDNGAGFDMQYVDKLFGAFQRLHGAQQFEGTGIGLAIVQRVILRHGGRIWAEGAPEGGATFRFTLPEIAAA